MTESNPKIGIVIVNWNGKEDTGHCLRSIFGSSHDKIEVVVVDNGSKDGSQDYIRRKFPGVTLVENGKNLGFGKANNIGASLAFKKGASQLMLLNNDTLIEKDALRIMVDRLLKDTRIGIVAPKIYFLNQANLIWYAGGRFYWHRGSPKVNGLRTYDKGQFGALREISFATGCAMLVRGELYDKIGLFHEDYFLYEEDSEFSLRTTEAGYKIVHEPRAIVYHKVKGSQESRQGDAYIPMSSARNRRAPFYFYYLTRNRLLTMRLHGGPHHWALFLPFFILSSLKKAADSFHYHNYQAIRAMMWGVVDFVKGNFGERKDLDMLLEEKSNET